MNIYLVRTRHYESRQLKRVWELLTLQDGPMKFHLLSKPLFFDKQSFEWEELFEVMEIARKENRIEGQDILVCITELTNGMNWFSAPDPSGSNNIFIHGKGWENYIYCDSIYPVIYEVIANVLQRKMFSSLDDEQCIHQTAIGCMNDMCGWKPDISLKFRTADICPDCLLRAREVGISDDVLKQSLRAFSNLRTKMMFSADVQEKGEFDEHLPFNVAITKRKMSSTSEPFKKFLFLIDHFDSLIRTAVIYWSSINFSLEGRADFFAENRLKERPSLGTWVLALQRLSTKTPSGIQLNDSINNKIQQLIAVASEGNIVELRNERRGHGYIDCSNSSYQKIFIENLPIVSEIEELLNPLFHFNRLYYINRSSIVGANRIEITALSLGGSYAVFEESQKLVTTSDLNDVPIQERVYLYNEPSKKWYNLEPLIVFDNCPACAHQRLLIIDGQGIYIDPLIGHRVAINHYVTALQ